LKVSVRGEGEFLEEGETARRSRVVLRDGEEGNDEPHGLEDEVELLHPKVECLSSDVMLSWNVEPRGAGADGRGFDTAENTESASDKEGVESAVWGRWDEEADRGETGDKSA
jgi:hypothetical protein